MNLKGILAGSQRSGADFYRKLAQAFESNQVIRETWAAMAQDMDLQATSLENLAPGFWRRLKEDTEPSLDSERAFPTQQQLIDIKENISLQACFVATLNLEEPLILRAYVPLIRHLRQEFSDQALEFYIMVKAHVARLSRLIQPFAGDPGLLQRVTSLQQQFEHEVQAPAVPPVVVKPTAARKSVASLSPPGSKQPAASKKASKATARARKTLPLSKRAKNVPKLAKGLMGKLELPRRRARR